MALTARQVWRDYVVDGVPSSGPYKPYKPDIRNWGTNLEGFLTAVGSNAGTVKLTRALLYADLLHAADTMAWVMQDATINYNGIYQKIGASGVGSWARVADLPFSFIVATDAGAGTPNAIIATSDMPASESALIVFTVFEANTASPATVSFNGSSPLTIKTNSGNDIAAGGLTAGLQVFGRVIGSTFRLITDQVNAAIVAAAEAAAASASGYRDQALGYRDQAQAYAETALEATLARGYLFGGEISNNATDLTNDLDIAAGVAATDDAAPGMMVWSAVTRQLDVAYGTGNGGRFDSAIADGTWHIFACTNGTLVAIGMSQSLNPTGAANYPSGYTKYRRLGSRVRISGAWRRVVQRGDRHMMLDPLPQTGNPIAVTTSAALLALSAIPTGIEVDALFEVSYTSATVSAGAEITSPIINDAAPGAGNAGSNVGHIQVTNQYTAGSLRVRTNTSGQVRHRGGASGNMYIAVHGWFDDRGSNVFKGGPSSGISSAGGEVRSSQYNTLQDAITAAAGKRLVIEAGSYTTTGLTGVSNIEITTSGPVTISTTTNAPILDMTNCVNWSIRGHIRFVGNATTYTGYPGSLTDAGQKGIKLSNCDRYLIDGKIEFANINGSGLYAELSAGSWQHDGIIKGIRATSCYHGIRYTNVAEYDHVSDFSISNCAFAVMVESGNVMFSDGKMNYNSVCVSLGAGSNNAHGEFINCQMNHSNYAVDATGITLGEVFTGCIALGDQAGSGHGTIRLTNSVGIIWNGGQIGADISLDATSKMGLLNAYIRTDLTNAPSVAGGGVFLAKNNIANTTGALWAYNN
ncbi:hypothetical protein GGE68_002930 [Rhizobium leguminosarum]|uniref:hypothetical protein n=1 Tax=Rhizobium leguminosarum TaxID=384 RepID=UPI0016099091|nr:hypothetical protein [Rhizobium leguminosarum]MBB5664733.1 hypothetical protein [Rhizobium leguminosarum]